MEIESIEIKAHGDKIIIPEGYKVTINGNEIVVEKEEKEEVQEFKDGDVLHSIYDDLMLIYKESCSSECFSSHFNMMHNYNTGWNTLSFRHATEEEKQLLFDKMKEQGLRWNAEEKRVENIRWRAEKGQEYHFLSNGLTEGSATETNVSFDKELWDSFNYFRTEEQAEEAARRVKETLRKYHEEIGE